MRSWLIVGGGAAAAAPQSRRPESQCTARASRRAAPTPQNRHTRRATPSGDSSSGNGGGGDNGGIQPVVDDACDALEDHGSRVCSNRSCGFGAAAPPPSCSSTLLPPDDATDTASDAVTIDEASNKSSSSSSPSLSRSCSSPSSTSKRSSRTLSDCAIGVATTRISVAIGSRSHATCTCCGKNVGGSDGNRRPPKSANWTSRASAQTPMRRATIAASQHAKERRFAAHWHRSAARRAAQCCGVSKLQKSPNQRALGSNQPSSRSSMNRSNCYCCRHHCHHRSPACECAGAATRH
jgi:hypothetical protein